MKRLLLAILLGFCDAARSEDWVEMSADDTMRTFVDAAPRSRVSTQSTRFSIKHVYHRRRDMMGLGYDGTLKTFSIACESGLILLEQHQLLDGDQVVWTFPTSDEKARASKEIPDNVIRRICPPG